MFSPSQDEKGSEAFRPYAELFFESKTNAAWLTASALNTTFENATAEYGNE